MALTKFTCPGVFSLLATANKLEVSPAYVYENGRKTDKQRTFNKQPVFRLRGALPLIGGEVVPDGFVYVTSEDVPSVEIGNVLDFSGEISVRAAKGFGLTCSLIGALTSENNEFSLEEV